MDNLENKNEENKEIQNKKEGVVGPIIGSIIIIILIILGGIYFWSLIF